MMLIHNAFINTLKPEFMQVGPNNSVAVTREYSCSRTKPSVAIISALAEIKNINPADFEISLQRIFDVDALNRLITDGQEVNISFVYQGYQISINDSELIIEIQDEQA